LGGSDINTSAKPLVEADIGPALEAIPSRQLAHSFSQLVQAMAVFTAGSGGFSSAIGAPRNDVANPTLLAANLLHHNS
jgi:hypothetical protein